MDTSIILNNNNFSKISEQQKHQNNYPCKVRFQSLHSNSINGFTTQNLPTINNLPQSRWRRFGSLKLISSSNKNKEQQKQQIRPLAAMSAIAHRQQQSVRRLLTTTEEEDEEEDDDEDEEEEEEETSSNSVPLNNKNLASNNFDGRRKLMEGEKGKEEKMSSAGYHSSQSGNSTKALFMAMHQNRSKSSTSPNVVTNNGLKKRLESKESVSGSVDSFHSKLCFFGVLRIETGARLFLFFYVALSACGVIIGSVATMVWILVPLVVVPLAAYALSRHTSKCLYPFLVVSVIHSLVAFGMTIIVGCFSLLCFDQLKEHFAVISSQSLPHSSLNSQKLQHFTSSPQSNPILPFFASTNSSSMTALFYCALTMLLSLALAIFFFWQSIVLFSCISHFDVLFQQRRQHEQQLKQSTAVGIESRVHSLASAPADFKGTQPVITGTHSRPMECSQCISEIRQLDQFSDLRASFRKC